MPTTRYSSNPNAPPPAFAASTQDERQTCIEIDRSIAAGDVAPADLEEAAGREFQPFLGAAGLLLPLQPWAGLETAAESDARRRRFLDGDQHIVPVRVGMGDLGDLHPPEQAQRRDATPRLDQGGESQGSAGLEPVLAQDDLRIVRKLPTTRMWSTIVCGPSTISNVRSTRD